MLLADGHTDNLKTVYPPQTKFLGGIIIDFNRVELKCYKTNFHCTITGEPNGAF